MKNYKRQIRNTAGTSRRKNVHPISGVLNSLVRSLGLSRNYNGWLVVNNWPDIVGEQVARVSRAVRFEDGILFVAVEKDAWRQELTMQIESILANIRRLPYGGAVQQVRLVGPRKGI